MTALLVSFQDNLDALGLKALHHYLLEHGFASVLLHLPRFYGRDPAALRAVAAFVARTRPGLIGLTVMSAEFGKARDLTRALKACAPAVPVVWGGIHPTIAPESCLDHADLVCVGEGERTLLDLARALRDGRSPDGVNNLCLKENGRIRRNPLYPLIENLDELPASRQVADSAHILHGGAVRPLDAGLLRRYDRFFGGAYSAVTSRGCPYSCAYCCNSARARLYGRDRLRLRGLESVMAELERAVRDNPGLRCINFLDDCFLGCGDERLAAFCRAYGARIKLPFVAKAMPEYVTRPRLELLKAAGLAWLQMGLQSGSARICREVYRRNSTKEQFLAAAGLVHDAGIAPYYDVIVDNPFEAAEDSLETVEALARTPKPFYAQFYSLVIYPGTGLYDYAQARLPGAVEDCTVKNYFDLRSGAVNEMTKLASFFGARPMARLTALYRRAPGSAAFRLALLAYRAAAFFALAPLSYFGVLRLAQGGSVPRTLLALPMHVREWAARRR